MAEEIKEVASEMDEEGGERGAEAEAGRQQDTVETPVGREPVGGPPMVSIAESQSVWSADVWRLFGICEPVTCSGIEIKTVDLLQGSDCL